MERELYTYALIKSFYDEGDDYLDAFWPFVIRVVPSDNYGDLKSIQDKVKSQFSLEVPLHVLQTILNRAKRKDYIKQEKKQYKLLKKGRKYLEKFKTDREVEREINALLDDIIKFFNENNISISQKEIYSLIISFINKNIDPLIEEFIGSSFTWASLSAENMKAYEKLIIDYIKVAEHKKPKEFNTLQNLFLGSIISAILYVEDSSDLEAISKKKFKNCKIFLDTNFIFSVLELHTPEFNESAKELFNTLKKFRFNLMVFDFTIDEICRVIDGYTKESSHYPYSIAVDTIYSSLKRKGWTKTKAIEFIMDIENILSKKGIDVEWTGIDIDKYQPKNDGLMDIIINRKPLKPLSSQNHDLAAIEKIKEIRGRSVRRIEESKAIFLTSDGILSRLNFSDMSHKENGTVSEVILDRLMACILWLKYPSAKLTIKSIITSYSRDLFIKRRVWDRFYKILKQLEKTGEVNDDNISMLFYHSYIEGVLRDIDESEVGKITKDFVLEEIEKSARAKEEKEAKLIKEKEKEFLEQLHEEVSKKEQKKEKEFSEKIEKIKRNLRKSAERKANGYSILYSSILMLFWVGVMYVIYLLCKEKKCIEFWKIMLTLSIGGGGIWGIFKKFRRWIKNKLSDRIYNQMLQEISLDEEMRK